MLVTEIEPTTKRLLIMSTSLVTARTPFTTRLLMTVTLPGKLVSPAATMRALANNMVATRNNMKRRVSERIMGGFSSWLIDAGDRSWMNGYNASVNRSARVCGR